MMELDLWRLWVSIKRDCEYSLRQGYIVDYKIQKSEDGESFDVFQVMNKPVEYIVLNMKAGE